MSRWTSVTVGAETVVEPVKLPGRQLVEADRPERRLDVVLDAAKVLLDGKGRAGRLDVSQPSV
jgi:hypothetical protein